MASSNDQGLITHATATKYDLLAPMVAALLDEMRELSKKKQDMPLNQMKIKMSNRLLKDVLELLGEDPSTAYLELLDEETLCTNSDAVLMMGQFWSAMQQFRDKHYRYDMMENGKRWITKEKPLRSR